MSDVYDHPEYRALLAAVCAAPDDDLPRLVCADWLDEHGESERAEFIRVQCRIPQVEATLAKRHPDQGLCTEVSARWCPVCGDCCCPEPEDGMDDLSCPLHSPHSRHAGDESLRSVLAKIRRRERELFDRHATTWFGDRWAILVCGRPEEDSTVNYPDLGHDFVYRGFIAEWHGPLSGWCGGECHQCAGVGRAFPITGPSIPCRRCGGSLVTGIGPAVVRSHPVARVVLTDREPRHDAFNGVWVWGGNDGPDETSWLPGDVFRLLSGDPVSCYLLSQSKRFPTRQLAHAAISAAAISWAKSHQPSEVTA